LAACRLSFFSLCLYVPNSWGAAASDFYVYYPERTSKVKVFLLTMVGLMLSFSLVYMLAIGLATGIANNTSWSDANDISTGALIVAGFAPLKGFGSFCSVVVALGVISNSVPGTYASSLDCQVMGRYGMAVPRWVWCGVLVVIQLVLALAGREHLFTIFQNFLALMGYWLMIMICLVGEEHVLFKWNMGFDWSRWNDKSYLPVGWASLISFLLGWMGAILGMSQVWYVGPLAQLAHAGDVGMWVGCGFAMISYPPLRMLEIKIHGR
jgi:purine-cytosine permease-like protein